MTLATFVPDVWSSVLLSSLKKAEVFRALCNTDYEGEISAMGDTVHITSVSRPTISTYGVGGVVTYQQLASADRALIVDQSDFFAFEVDDIDKRQAAGNVLPEALLEAAYGLADKADTFIASKYVDVQAANIVGAGGVSITTGAIAYTQLTKLRQKLDEANVPTQGRWVVVPPWFYALLLDTPNFIANPAPNTASPILTGMIGGEEPKPGAGGFGLLPGSVGRILGMEAFESNNIQNIAGNRWAVMAGSRQAITYADQINQVEGLRLQGTFADAVRGLHLYGAKTVRPDAMAYIDASTT